VTRLAIRAPAKINLGLEITRRRTDGYHDVVTILQALEFGDTVHISHATSIDGISSVHGLSQDRDLVFRAAHNLHCRVHPRTGVYIQVQKRIPVAAGMGGGSSDAGAVLRGLHVLWNANWSAIDATARSLGTDLPFFLQPGTALGLGRGDELRTLPPAPPRWVILARPHQKISTIDAYTNLRPEEYSGGGATFATARNIENGKLEPELLKNDLQAAAVRLVPEVADVLHALEDVGARPALLSGSGATCFGLFPDEDAAQTAETKLKSHNWWMMTTRFLRPE
jgi:4-diphosphocytidyl-2-C-methyl-D-erythritol kinase